jgi:peptidoglycan/xylan/chitin deacetylase (PgdA/CDA1 family)
MNWFTHNSRKVAVDRVCGNEIACLDLPGTRGPLPKIGSGSAATSRLAILAFHKIGEPPRAANGSCWYIGGAEFRRHLEYLATNRWEVISVDDFVRGLSDPEALPKRAALITFDDGYKSLLDCASRCLVDFGYPAVAFVPTHYVEGYNDFDNGKEPKEAICSWNDLRELERLGISVQSHGIRHRSFRCLSLREQEKEVTCSKRIVEERLGKPVQLFAYPYGHTPAHGRRALGDLLKRVGYRAAFLFRGGVKEVAREDTYFMPRVGMYPGSDLATILGDQRDDTNRSRKSL